MFKIDSQKPTDERLISFAEVIIAESPFSRQPEGHIRLIYVESLYNSFDAILDKMDEFPRNNYGGNITVELYSDGADVVLSITDNGKTIEFNSEGMPKKRKRIKRKHFGGLGRDEHQGTSTIKSYLETYFGGAINWYPLKGGTKTEIRIPKKNIPPELQIPENKYITIENTDEKRRWEEETVRAVTQTTMTSTDLVMSSPDTKRMRSSELFEAIKKCLGESKLVSPSEIQDIELALVPDNDTTHTSNISRSQNTIFIQQSHYDDHVIRRKYFMENLITPIAQEVFRACAEKEASPDRAETLREKSLNTLPIDLVNMIISAAECMIGTAPLFDLDECKKELTRHEKGEIVNVWNIERSIIMLTPVERKALLEYIQENRILDGYDFLSGRIPGILGEGHAAIRVYYAVRKGFYKHFPVYDIWDKLYAIADARNDAAMRERLRLYTRDDHKTPLRGEFNIAASGKGFISHGFKNNAVDGMQQMVQIYGQPYTLQDQWAMLNVMIDKMRKGEFGCFSLEGGGYPNVDNPIYYGPYYFFEKIGTEGEGLYVVPEQADLSFLRESLTIAVHKGLVDRGKANNALKRVMMYEQFIDNKEGIESILRGEIPWDSGVTVPQPEEPKPLVNIPAAMNRTAFYYISMLIGQDLHDPASEYLENPIPEAREQAMIDEVKRHVKPAELAISKTHHDVLLAGFELDKLRYNGREDVYELPIYRNGAEEFYYRFYMKSSKRDLAIGKTADMVIPFGNDRQIYIDVVKPDPEKLNKVLYDKLSQIKRKPVRLSQQAEEIHDKINAIIYRMYKKYRAAGHGPLGVMANPSGEGMYWPSKLNVLGPFLEALDIKPGDTFLDAGSGYGAPGFLISHMFNIQATGIEVHKSFHDFAGLLKDELCKEGIIDAEKIELINKNFIDSDIDFSPYSLISYFSGGTIRTKGLLDKMLTVRKGARVLIHGHIEEEIERVLALHPDFEMDILALEGNAGITMRVYTRISNEAEGDSAQAKISTAVAVQPLGDNESFKQVIKEIKPFMLISGPHGSGKTTIGKELSKILDIPFVSMGELISALPKEQRVGHYGRKAFEDYLRQNEIDIQYGLITDFHLRKLRPESSELPFSQYWIDVVKKYSLEVIDIHLEVDREEVDRRITQRGKGESKEKRQHDWEKYESVEAENIQRLRELGIVIDVENDGPVNDTIQTIISRLERQFWNESPNPMSTPRSEQSHSIEFVRAANEAKPDFIALGTSWIEGYEKGRYLQYNALNPLISSMAQFCEKKDIPFICGDDALVASEVQRLKRANPDARGIVLAGEEAVNSLGLENDENIFMAGVNNEKLTIDSYMPIMEMLALLMRLLDTKAIDEEALREAHKRLGIRFDPNKKRCIYFTPESIIPEDYEKLRDIYKVQIFA
ncbi:MAG: AAA family ATPase [Candidatus Omnitrophica bacterium]|nr:AAA family ATPase [Candidatus Omnitrophota bacterium]